MPINRQIGRIKEADYGMEKKTFMLYFVGKLSHATKVVIAGRT